MSKDNSNNEEEKRIILPRGTYFLIGPDGEREITDYYSLTNRERWLLHLPQLKEESEQENDTDVKE